MAFVTVDSLLADLRAAISRERDHAISVLVDPRSPTDDVHFARGAISGLEAALRIVKNKEEKKDVG